MMRDINGTSLEGEQKKVDQALSDAASVLRNPDATLEQRSAAASLLGRKGGKSKRGVHE
ncbi:hypothetical protein J8F10_24240 [Gemmata sp. G18]|uniref:Uncharacterized protein n=1 Tax=Gemmata palustris TaxID=2822762 RepID=A0ABS5BXA8_9BACT|nr:hypothetical protein [Gemmata palustris]MBP3958371.1 hypothetical protein [Gemmata palustris]